MKYTFSRIVDGICWIADRLGNPVWIDHLIERIPESWCDQAEVSE